MKHRIFALCIILTLLCAFALAEESPASAPVINDVGLDLLGSSVHYPQLSGLADEALQTQINKAIVTGGGIDRRLDRMALLLSSPVKLNVTYRAAVVGDIFSCAFLSEGAVVDSSDTQVWTSVNINLTTGETLPLDGLFTDAPAARAFLEAHLNGQIAPELSAHLGASALTPLPETFSLSETGLTLYYPIEDFRTLSNGAGTIHLLWYELADYLPERPVPADDLTALTAGGTLPGLPAALGQNMQEIVDAFALLTDADLYEGGRMIALEDDRFRQVWLLTDALSEDFDESVVQGIRADRMQLGALVTGQTTREDWQTLLGQPRTTLQVDAERADSWRIVPGTSDYYDIGDYRLRLHADEDGVLRSIFLTD